MSDILVKALATAHGFTHVEPDDIVRDRLREAVVHCVPRLFEQVLALSVAGHLDRDTGEHDERDGVDIAGVTCPVATSKTPFKRVQTRVVFG